MRFKLDLCGVQACHDVWLTATIPPCFQDKTNRVKDLAMKPVSQQLKFSYTHKHFGDGLIFPKPSAGVFAVMLNACTPLASSSAST